MDLERIEKVLNYNVNDQPEPPDSASSDQKGVTMHTAPMTDSDGEFKDWKPVDNERNFKRHKPECKGSDIRYRKWESSCGGYEDYQYRCFSCGVVWWVEGADT